mmetsp:Transcript_99694/g.302696  ORF Transcript_99694/g.302696 Transcript_99694/m.302696 type:complete len:205 (-) Transcript_99694:493-1107(-)
MPCADPRRGVRPAERCVGRHRRGDAERRGRERQVPVRSREGRGCSSAGGGDDGAVHTASAVRRLQRRRGEQAARDGRQQAPDQGRRQPGAGLLERGDDPQDDPRRHRHLPPQLLPPPWRRLRARLPPHPQVRQRAWQEGGGLGRPPGPQVPSCGARWRSGSAHRGRNPRVRHLQGRQRPHQARAHHHEVYGGAEGACLGGQARH